MDYNIDKCKKIHWTWILVWYFINYRDNQKKM